MIGQTMTSTATILADSVDRLFAQSIADDRARLAWDPQLWDAVSEQGIPEGLAATIGEDPQDADRLGQEGALNLLFLAGRHAAPLPLAEHMVAAWLATQAGLEMPSSGPLVIAGAGWHDAITIDDHGTVSGSAVQVAFARHAGAILAVSETRCAIVPLADAELTPWHDTAQEPRDRLRFASAQAASAALPCDLMMVRAGLAGARAIQMAGALERVLEITAQYVQERKQFGRTIAKFQAVQQALAELGGQVATTKAAATLAAQSFGDPAGTAVLAAAKIRTSEAVSMASRIAHQAHGAIGFTLEYDLQRFTRRLWSWRDDYGSDSTWAHWLGLALTQPTGGNDSEGLWAKLTDGMRSVSAQVQG